MSGELIVDLSKLKIIKFIGEGSYGRVYLVELVETKEKFAAKESRVMISSPDEQKIFFNEIIAYSKVKNPAILSLVGLSLFSFEGDLRPVIINEYMPNGSLDKFLLSNPGIPLSKKYIILIGIALGMKCLHSHGIIHRDLKPANVLIDSNIYPYICDFGESAISNLSLSAIRMNEEKGTPVYMAPEIFTEIEDYSYKADIYSYSILFYEVLSGKNPYPEYHASYSLLKDVEKGKRPDLSVFTNQFIKDFLMKCWIEDPNKRPTFNEIIEELLKEKYQEVMEVDKDELQKYLLRFGDEIPKLRKSDNPDDSMSINNAIDIKKDADNGDVSAMFQYATMLLHGNGIDVNYEKAAYYYEMAAKNGDIKAMNIYATMLSKGKGVPKDSEKAAHYLEMAADKGYIVAMLNYAIVLSHGEGVKMDKKKAAQYYKNAADKGDPRAMNNYALMLSTGDGIEKNKTEASCYYKKAADMGDCKAMYNYANMLYKGDGIQIDKKEAANYYKKAADKGYYKAIGIYAKMLSEGDGIDINKEEADLYFKKINEK